MQKDWSVDLKLELLNRKLDTILVLLENVYIKKKKQEESNETTWTMEDYKESVLVKFSFNIEFKAFVKELGGKWMVSKKAWVFSNINKQEIKEQLLDKFPFWKFEELKAEQ